MGMTDLEEYFTRVYEAVYADLVRFVVRRAGREVAEDIAAEALAVAWRRSDDLPRDLDGARPWLFGIARRLVLAHHRTSRGALPVPLAEPTTAGHDDEVALRTDLAHAWRQLSARHQEALSLTVWDGLSGAQAAEVLGISPVAYRIRLSRARTALRALLDHPPGAVTTRHPSLPERTRS